MSKTTNLLVKFFLITLAFSSFVGTSYAQQAELILLEVLSKENPSISEEPVAVIVKEGEIFTTLQAVEAIIGTIENSKKQSLETIPSIGTDFAQEAVELYNVRKALEIKGLKYSLDIPSQTITIEGLKQGIIVDRADNKKTLPTPSNNKLSYEDLKNPVKSTAILSSVLENAALMFAIILGIVLLFWLLIAPYIVKNLMRFNEKRSLLKNESNSEKYAWKVTDHIYYMVGGLGLFITVISLFAGQISEGKLNTEQSLNMKWSYLENHNSRCDVLSVGAASQDDPMVMYDHMPIDLDYIILAGTKNEAMSQWLCSIHSILLNYPLVAEDKVADPHGIYSGKIVTDTNNKIYEESFVKALYGIAKPEDFTDTNAQQNYTKLLNYLEQIDALRAKWKDYNKAGNILFFDLGPDSKMLFIILVLMAYALGTRLARVSWEKKEIRTSKK